MMFEEPPFMGGFSFREIAVLSPVKNITRFLQSYQQGKVTLLNPDTIVRVHNAITADSFNCYNS